jgi:hypothetical protein
MISDTNVSTDEGSTEKENTAMRLATSLGAEQPTESLAEHAATTTEKPKAVTSGRRAVLRNLRENVGAISKDLSSFRKNDEVSAKRLEKQVSQMHSEVTSLKRLISKESADAVKKHEAYVSKILAKLDSKPRKKAKRKK